MTQSQGGHFVQTTNVSLRGRNSLHDSSNYKFMSEINISKFLSSEQKTTENISQSFRLIKEHSFE